jgi:hypothetical protein
MSHPGPGKGFASSLEVMMMGLIPLGLTLEIRKTRTGWSVTVRVYLIT